MDSCRLVVWISTGILDLGPASVDRVKAPARPGCRTVFETDEGWSVSCLDLPGCHSQGESRDEALFNIREAFQLWLEAEAEETGVKTVETLELAI